MNQPAVVSSEEIHVATFHCGEMLVGLDLADVQEINRHRNFAEVPEAPPQICGVLNLRGDVITMLDLRVVLKQRVDPERRTHNVFVRHGEEVLGLVTDGVSDIVSIGEHEIDATPANVKGIDQSYFRGVHTTHGSELVVILDLNQVLGDAN